MSSNLQVYHNLLEQLCQWLPDERITRLRNMALLLMGLQVSGGIHLSLIVRKWPVPGKDVSLVNRLRRFLNNPRVDVGQWYRPIALRLLRSFAGQPLHLVIDITKVGLGYRMMSISIAYKKRTLPLAWSVHRGRKGHVDVHKQRVLFEYVRDLLPEDATVWVLADAGFESVHLLHWLQAQGWHFVLRRNGKNLVRWPEQSWIRLNAISIQPGETHTIGWVYLTQKHDAGPFWLVVHWQPREEEPWYLISDCSDQQQLIKLYKMRMWVEEMYGDMKGHGFDLEATHLDDVDRISRLVLAVCISYVWFITLGSWVVKRGFRHLVDHKCRRDKSYFRIGWDWIERCRRHDRPVPLHFKPYF